MKAPFKSVLWVLPVLLAGCTHKTQQAQVQPLAPPIVATPPPTPQPAAADTPPQVVTVPQQQQPQQPPEPEPPAKQETKPAHRQTHHNKTSEPAKPTEQAANTAGPEVSAIGQLTSGDSGDLRGQTEQAVASIDQGLKRISRPLSDQEQKTAAQIREFLKQARTALGAGDVDGAHTLAMKARVLLGELSK